MRVHLIKKSTLEEFALHHGDSRISLRLWLAVLKEAEWKAAKDILVTYSFADLLGNGCDRVVFNIGGNKYRMICHYVFGENQVHLFVCWIGTHAAYTKLCKENKQYTISNY